MTTKKCTCKKWQDIVGDEFSKNIDPFSSRGFSIPMYFGKIIDFCPWCGCRLTTNTADGKGQGEKDKCNICGKPVHETTCIY